MKKMLALAGALTAGMAMSASAASIDFTANDDESGNILPTNILWTVTSSGNGDLTNSRHFNDTGCDAVAGWEFDCRTTDNGFDVGFGVASEVFDNDNEIDNPPDGREFVQVAFDTSVVINAFAGMLTYDRELPLEEGAREEVRLRYSNDGGDTWDSVTAEALFELFNNTDDEPFDTVGLAYLGDLEIVANVVQFRAAGDAPFDDGNRNITAAGLKVSEVPLPAAGWMLLAGLGGLTAMKRRKK